MERPKMSVGQLEWRQVRIQVVDQHACIHQETLHGLPPGQVAQEAERARISSVDRPRISPARESVM